MQFAVKMKNWQHDEQIMLLLNNQQHPLNKLIKASILIRVRAGRL